MDGEVVAGTEDVVGGDIEAGEPAGGQEEAGGALVIGHGIHRVPVGMAGVVTAGVPDGAGDSGALELNITRNQLPLLSKDKKCWTAHGGQSSIIPMKP